MRRSILTCLISMADTLPMDGELGNSLISCWDLLSYPVILSYNIRRYLFCSHEICIYDLHLSFLFTYCFLILFTYFFLILISGILLVTRFSIWPWIFGISFERAIKFHRLVGRLFIINVSVHALWMIIAYIPSVFGRPKNTE